MPLIIHDLRVEINRAKAGVLIAIEQLARLSEAQAAPPAMVAALNNAAQHLHDASNAIEVARLHAPVFEEAESG